LFGIDDTDVKDNHQNNNSHSHHLCFVFNHLCSEQLNVWMWNVCYSYNIMHIFIGQKKEVKSP
jgi:hypothetical protein